MFEARGFGYDMSSSGEPTRRGRDLQIRIAEDIGEIEAAFPRQTFGIDGEPTARSGIQDVIVMDVTMQHSNIMWFREQFICCPCWISTRVVC